MHAAEMEAESRRLRHFTDSRFKLKTEQYDKGLANIKEEATNFIEKIRQEAE